MADPLRNRIADPLRRIERRLGERARHGWRRLREGRPARPPEVTAETAPAQARAIPKPLVWTGSILLVLIAAIVAFLAWFDWNYLRGPIGRYASERLNRTVALNGDLDVNLFSWTPGATVRGLTIGQPAWAGPGQMAEVERLDVKVKLLPLFKRDVVLPLVDVDKPRVRLLRDENGRANWDFGARKTKEPARLPPIQLFVIRDGRLDIEDRARKLTFKGTVSASETRGAANQGFQMVGEGALNGSPFSARITGGPLINVRTDQPYPFDGDVRAGSTRILAKGAVPKPFDLGHFHANLDMRGADLANLYHLTGLALPNTPPYRVRGRLVRDDLLYRFNDFNGRLGDSDIAGSLSVDTSGKRPFLRGQAVSNRVDYDDIGAIFGGAPSTAPGEAASPEQKAVAREQAARGLMLPDSPLQVERVRAMDADFNYRARQIVSPHLPLRAASLKVRLNDGLLKLDPLEITLPRGEIDGRIAIDARQATPITDLDLRLRGARLENFVPVSGQSGPAVEGAFVARAKLVGAGASVHRAASNANGDVTFVIPQGEIRKAFAELMGINVIKGLGLLLSKDESQTPIRCGVASFKATNGVLRANNIVVDTKPVLIKGAGTIDLARERIDFRLRGEPKKFRLIRVRAPITVEGPIRAPKVGVDAGKAVGQGGVAAALGALVSPLAAVLPFVDPGLAENADCAALLGEGAAKGAPVRVAAR